MAWFNRHKNKSESAQEVTVKSGTAFHSDAAVPNQLGDSVLWVADPGIPLGGQSNPWQIFSTQPSVRKVIQFIARNTARIPLRAYRQVSPTDREPITDGPIFNLINHPRQYEGSYRFFYDLICDLLIYDRFAATLIPSSNSSSGYELYRLPAYTWRFTWSGYEDVNGILLNTNGGTNLNLDGVFWDKGYGGANGVSPMHTLQQVLQEYSESVKWRRAIWKNGARMTGIFSQDKDMQPLSEEAQKRLETDLANYMDGGGNEGKVPVALGLNWIPVNTFSPKDTQEVEGRTLADIEVASAYAVPPEMVGARKATYANAQAFRDALYQETLGPLFTQLEQAFNEQIIPLLTDDPLVCVEFDLQSALSGSFIDQAIVTQQAVGGPWMSVNEGRSMNKLDKLDAKYDEIITPLNVTRGGGTQANPHDSGSQNIGGLNANS
ncbi:MAG: phage portal protein [Bifidobacterium psychraerophilum]|uniref:phage portal protein n=1 Tax=Bifidobacterium psychraerophilum TaxID=218140 RepID=UPI0039E8B936